MVIKCAQAGYPFPTYVADSVAGINFKLIRPKFVGFDLDGTLAPPGSDDLLLEAIENIRESLSDGSIGTGCIISNARIWVYAERVARLAKICGLPYLACYHPGPVKPDERAFMAARRLCGADKFDPSECVFVGDQLADMAAGRYGYQTILVPTLRPVPWWKQRKLDKERRLFQALGIHFSSEYRRG